MDHYKIGCGKKRLSAINFKLCGLSYYEHNMVNTISGLDVMFSLIYRFSDNLLVRSKQITTLRHYFWKVYLNLPLSIYTQNSRTD